MILYVLNDFMIYYHGYLRLQEEAGLMKIVLSDELKTPVHVFDTKGNLSER
jgi:hypothetical protein